MDWNSGDTVASATEEFSKQYEYDDNSTNARLLNILEGPSGALYYMGYVIATNKTVIIKEDANGNIIWGKGFYVLSLDSNSFVMDPEEEYLYTIESDPGNNHIKIMKYDTETGEDPLVFIW